MGRTTPIKASEIRCSRRRKPVLPAAPKAPRPYLKSLRTTLSGYVKVTSEIVLVDGENEGYIFNVYTKGGSNGAQHIDTWFAIENDGPQTGYVELGSVRTPWALRIEPSPDFERAAAVAIAKVTGVRDFSRANMHKCRRRGKWS